MAKKTTVVTAKTIATKAPKNLSIARNGNKFSASWKIGDDNYGGFQEFAHRTISATSWTYTGLGKTSTAKSVTIDKANFWPRTSKKISAVSISVRGQRKLYTVKKNKKNKALGEYVQQTDYYPQPSAWTNKQFSIIPPYAPTITQELVDGADYSTKFSWTVHDEASDSAWFTDLVWESILVKDCNVSLANGKTLPWKSSTRGWGTGTSTANSSTVFTEGDISDGSYTRWFRAKTRGPAGERDWVYSKHVYAMPYQAVFKSFALQRAGTQGYTITVKWDSKTNEAHPIDQTTVEWVIATPTADMGVEDGLSWTTAVTVADYSGGTQSAVFSISDAVGANQCLFIRVNNMHDTEASTSRGVPQLIDTGKLTKPTITNIQYPEYTVTIYTGYDPPVEGAFLVVTYKTASNPDVEQKIGIITDPADPPTINCPNWSGEDDITFGVYAAVGTYTYTTDSNGVRTYDVNAKMISDTTYDRATLATAPTTIEATTTNIPETIRVMWDWSWNDADVAELSWADHADAWESTAEPDSYIVQKRYASAWNISGLEAGVRWYVRVRLGNETADETIWGPWSEIAWVDLAAAPAKPSLDIYPAIIPPDGTVTASWGYVSRDGTVQAHAEVAELTIVEGNPVYTKVAETESAQHLTINAEEKGWQAGETHNLVVRVTSASGQKSDDWSDPVPVIIATPLTATVSQTSLQTVQIPDDDESTRSQLSLTVMPMTVTVTGAGVGGTTIVAIERAEDFIAGRPDERRTDCFKGETIFLVQQTGEGQVTITQDDLIGSLDDGAQYNLVCTIMDGLGQTAEAIIPFEVRWAHQALIPDATVYTDQVSMISRMTPIAPEGWVNGDICDIYRLSVDLPELIYRGAQFGQTYIDPYPTVGPFGGHRFVYVTSDGDYITEDNRFAWIDTTEDDEDFLDLQVTIIDFGGDQVVLEYDMEISSQWDKDFIQTTYLGGSIQGDWNPAVKRSGSVSARSLVIDDERTIEKMRRLAAYAGICHVRTADGSSYAADVQVSEKQTYQTSGKIAEFDMSITRVDPEAYDAVALSEWEEQ